MQVRAARRLAQGRAKPIDWLVADLYGLGVDEDTDAQNDDAEDSEEEREKLRRQVGVACYYAGDSALGAKWLRHQLGRTVANVTCHMLKASDALGCTCCWRGVTACLRVQHVNDKYGPWTNSCWA